jgi:hypothetical protein
MLWEIRLLIEKSVDPSITTNRDTVMKNTRMSPKVKILFLQNQALLLDGTGKRNLRQL